jgi:hypothetical protein
MGWIADKLGFVSRQEKEILLIFRFYSLSLDSTRTLIKWKQGLIWPGHEARLNVVAKRQMSAPA